MKQKSPLEVGTSPPAQPARTVHPSPRTPPRRSEAAPPKVPSGHRWPGPALTAAPPDAPADPGSAAVRPLHRLQRAVGNQGLQRLATAEHSAAGARRIAALLHRGRPLPDALRASFAPRLGHDLRRVRLHTDARAAALASGLGARAFTVGHDVAFAAGEWAPERREGSRLLAHELTHVVQQERSGAGDPGAAEAQARRVGKAVAAGGRMAETPVPAQGIARNGKEEAGGPVEEISLLLNDPFWMIEDGGKPYRILNGLSVEHMLSVLSALRSGGYFATLYSSFETFATGIHRPRMKAVMEAVAQRRQISSAAFCLRYAELLATIEIEGVRAILVYLGGVPPSVRIGQHIVVGDKACAVCDSDIRCGGSRSWRGNNPGNLTVGVSDLAYPGTSIPGGPALIAIFPNSYLGHLALYDWAREKAASGLTIRQWVDHQLGPNPQPPDDPEKYAQDLANSLGTHSHARLDSVDIARFAEFVQRIEGWSPGETYDWGAAEAPEEILQIRAGVLFTKWQGAAGGEAGEAAGGEAATP